MTQPSPAILFRSGDTLVTDLGPTIRFERRIFTEGGLGLGALILGFVFWVESRGWPPSTNLVPDSFGTWTSCVLWLCGGLLIIVGLVKAIAPPWELSSELRCLKRGSRHISFADIRRVNVTETRMGNITAVGLSLDSTERQIWLVGGQPERRRGELQRVAERVTSQLGDLSASHPPAARSPTRFFVTFALVLGALWTNMVWIAPNVVVTYPGANHGLRIWPLGLWIAALGLGELAGLSLFQTLLGPWNRRRAILFVVWFGSYAAVAFVRL